MSRRLPILLVTLAALHGLSSNARSQQDVVRMCSTAMPASVEQKYDFLSEAPVFSAFKLPGKLTNEEVDKMRELQTTIQMGVMRGTYWQKGQDLYVAFLSGDPVVRNRIKQSAVKWELYANIRFLFVENPQDTDIRIGVDLNGKSESRIGNEARRVPKPSETMHFGWLTPASSQADYDSVVLHEFGHALGAIHEHQSPGGVISWNEPAVYDYCLKNWGWSREKVKQNILERYSPEKVQFTRLDPYSIMMYAFPASWTTDGKSMPWNHNLSDGDKQFIVTIYPK